MNLLFAGAKVYWHIFRPVNFGVQVMLIRDGQVVLVRHTYKPGWYFPGGGVKRKESVETAVRREALEETGAILGELQLVGLYANLHGPVSNHITLFACHDFELNGNSDDEIAEVKFFPLDQLPEDIGRGTRCRIEEYLNGGQRPAFGEW
jgi:8-oxo-dGTP pyrophosphatase MutT (NUDIX family)